MYQKASHQAQLTPMASLINLLQMVKKQKKEFIPNFCIEFSLNANLSVNSIFIGVTTSFTNVLKLLLCGDLSTSGEEKYISFQKTLGFNFGKCLHILLK